MRSLYKILDYKGRYLCYQVARSEDAAVETACIYYGYRGARSAVFVREEL